MDSEGVSKKNIFFAAFLTAVEYYDFIIYAYLASYIATVFFPPGNQALHLLETYAIFAAGYIMRPLGGIVFGNIGDRYGRKIALMGTVILMTGSLILMTLSPTYQQIGLLAPILLVSARLLQGFAIGGEYNGVLVALIENAPAHRRARTTFLSVFISGNSVIVATLVVGLLTGFYSDAQMAHFGWRIPYLFGVILSLIALLFIYKMQETQAFRKIQSERKQFKIPLLEAIKQQPMIIFMVFVLTGYLGIAYYMGATYVPNLMKSDLGFSLHTAMLVTLFSSIIYTYSAPIWAYVTDKIGRKPVLISSILLIMASIYPEFMALASKNITAIIITLSLTMLFVSACTVTFEVTINEAFPARIRYSGVAFGYNIGNALLGGTAMYVSQSLFELTGQITMPAIYLVVMSVITIGLIGYLLPETCGKVFRCQTS